MKQKPVLIGMNNPLSSMDGHQLFPAPEGCTGHRIWKMLQERLPHVSRRSYLDTFERRNLVVGQQWSSTLGRSEAERVFAEFWGSGRVIVLLGEDVRRAFGHPRLVVEPQLIGGCTWRQVPHPSGRNLWYNSVNHRKMVGTLLEELYENYHRDAIGLSAGGGVLEGSAVEGHADEDQRRRHRADTDTDQGDDGAAGA